VVCGLATSRASGLVEEAILYTCPGGSVGRQETIKDLRTLKVWFMKVQLFEVSLDWRREKA
jgi:hypothetical protein